MATDDLEGAIREHRGRLAVALLAGVNYATGQAHETSPTDGSGPRRWRVALWDLAHAAGNVPIALHDAGVDGAAWCTYKYLNGGPGSIAQLFLHERHATDAGRLRLAGWWGNDPATRFRDGGDVRSGPRSGRLADLDAADPVTGPIRASLALFDEVGLPAPAREVHPADGLPRSVSSTRSCPTLTS